MGYSTPPRVEPSPALVTQTARVPVLHTGGRGFESLRAHQKQPQRRFTILASTVEPRPSPWLTTGGGGGNRWAMRPRLHHCPSAVARASKVGLERPANPPARPAPHPPACAGGWTLPDLSRGWVPSQHVRGDQQANLGASRSTIT